MKPVFIIGCPRSGTTYLLRTLASNTNFTWVTHHVNNEPEKYQLVERLKLYKPFFFGKRNYFKGGLNNPTYPAACEPWGFWNHYFPYFQWKKDFCEVPRNARPEDVNDEEVQKIRSVVEEMCKINGTNVFLSKYTDFPRIQLMKKVFPEAKFIHLVRDGRAVANSYNQKIQKGEFQTSKEEMNWVSAWDENRQKNYLENHRHPLAFTLYQWMFFVDQILEELKTIPQDDFITVKYSDLIKDTKGEVEKIMSFIEVPLDSNMKFFIKNRPGQNMNNKWQERLEEAEKDTFDEVLEKDKYQEFLDF